MNLAHQYAQAIGNDVAEMREEFDGCCIDSKFMKRIGATEVDYPAEEVAA